MYLFIADSAVPVKVTAHLAADIPPAGFLHATEPPRACGDTTLPPPVQCVADRHWVVMWRHTEHHDVRFMFSRHQDSHFYSVLFLFVVILCYF